MICNTKLMSKLIAPLLQPVAERNPQSVRPLADGPFVSGFG